LRLTPARAASRATFNDKTMDIICTCCGEPWSIHHILHDAPEEFIRDGALITACECCKGVRPKLSEDAREYLDSVAEAASMFGDDLDGFACFLEDFS